MNSYENGNSVLGIRSVRRERRLGVEVLNRLRVVDKFPISATMRCNLACYECRLGRLEQAKMWLEKAFELGDAKQMKLAALDDPGLGLLWG